ncbi:hypothetical protein KGF54_004637 [Candida jiufengensis]|uniref:uncharacterized protein n=1 Tax=Candida jiufengensis TaxID=497108 RepID=UPI0022244D6B|nr:uncharacterized protein KGF54_004637 [Candida jiufengensis]KAI5951563.1 hypothetical protein KGF54_004637 [Candida jiufengensis]
MPTRINLNSDLFSPLNTSSLTNNISKKSISSSPTLSRTTTNLSTKTTSSTTNFNKIDLDLMFSKAEILVIKKLWKSLNICENFNKVNSNLDSNVIIHKFNYNSEEYSIFKSCLNHHISEYYKNKFISQRDLKFDNEISQTFQIDTILQILNVVIYHLCYKDNQQPQSFIMEQSKLLNRLYDLNFKKLKILGECIILSIIYLSNKNVKNETNEDNELYDSFFKSQFVLLKFLNNFFNILTYYGQDINMKLSMDLSTMSLTKDLPSIPLSPTNQNVLPKQKKSSTTFSKDGKRSAQSSPKSSSKNELNLSSAPNVVSGPLPSPDSFVFEKPTNTTRDSTSSINSIPSNYTEGSSVLSLNQMDDYSYLSNEIESMAIENKEQNTSEIDIDNYSIDDLEESTINTKNSVSTYTFENEKVKTPKRSSYEYEEEDASYDYLNSFGLSAIDDEPIYYNSKSIKPKKSLSHKKSSNWGNKLINKLNNNNFNGNTLPSTTSNNTLASTKSAKKLNKKKSLNLSLHKLNTNSSLITTKSITTLQSSNKQSINSISNHQKLHEQFEENDEEITFNSNENNKNNSTITDSNDESCVIM